MSLIRLGETVVARCLFALSTLFGIRSDSQQRRSQLFPVDRGCRFGVSVWVSVPGPDGLDGLVEWPAGGGDSLV